MNILAAFIFFTRLPLWRLREVPTACFKRMAGYWPLVGWLTGGTMAGVLWLALLVLPLPVAVLFALVSRLLLSGALHEDGLADFFDGFGGSTTRERTLAIMKDSHIGSYGVIVLILYYLLSWSILSSMPLPLLYVVLLTGDVWSKFVASQLINLLSYARKEEESKAKVVYNRMTAVEWLVGFACGALPFLLWYSSLSWLPALLPVITLILLSLLMKRRVQGYTGDCCGATFLLCELSFYLGTLITLSIWN